MSLGVVIDENGNYIDLDDPERPGAPVAPGQPWIPPGASFDTNNPSGVINAQNPNADPNLPFVQGGTTGGWIDGIGVTVGQGRSMTPAQHQANIAAAIAAGVPESWINDYLGRNPFDSGRMIEAYFSDAGVEDTRTGATGGSGGGGGSNAYNGGLAPPSTAAGWMPMFDAPIFEGPAPFVAPTIEEARNEPGFKFALETGMEAMENSAAAKGTLRTGGTLKDLIGFGNELGDRNYGNVFNRNLSTYGTNYGVSRDVFDRLYTARKDEYLPKKDEATINNKNTMDQWLAKLRASTDIFTEGARD